MGRERTVCETENKIECNCVKRVTKIIFERGREGNNV